MDKVFINFTNHPSMFWSKEQRMAAEQYGRIVDMPFPAVDANWTTEQVNAEAERFAAQIAEKQPQAVLCQGEMTLTYAMVRKLQAKGILVLAACSERKTHEEVREDGTLQRVSIFQFVQFRAY